MSGGDTEGLLTAEPGEQKMIRRVRDGKTILATADENGVLCDAQGRSHGDGPWEVVEE